MNQTYFDELSSTKPVYFGEVWIDKYGYIRGKMSFGIGNNLMKTDSIFIHAEVHPDKIQKKYEKDGHTVYETDDYVLVNVNC